MPPASESSTTQDCLYKSTSSVLLTLVLPKVQDYHIIGHSALELLRNPESIWTVIVINASQTMMDGRRTEPVEYLTPLAQFVRGVWGVIRALTENSQQILWKLRGKLHEPSAVRETTNPCNEQLNTKSCMINDDDFKQGQSDAFSFSLMDLIDDTTFTKSKLYHFIIRSCHEICENIITSLRAIREFESGQLRGFLKQAHPYEAVGISHWSTRLVEAITDLELLQKEAREFADEVRELVSH